ncbi:MAG TPA: DUF4136 domain-containing protein [Ramlibacter sp.]|nr:DUF4136 domain-containing protein [Ramlibacter sp.]
MRHSRTRLLGWLVSAALLLTGCGTAYVLDNNVQSFSNLAALPAQPTYRFERLPSQQLPAEDQLEAMADPALRSVGLRRDDANPHYSVQLSARVQRILSPWGSLSDGLGWAGWDYGGGYRYHHAFGHLSAMDRLDPFWDHREVGIIVRELASNRVVFESHAVSEGPWLDNSFVFPAMFRAALQGFPNPPAGPRVVNIQLGS